MVATYKTVMRFFLTALSFDEDWLSVGFFLSF